jgi:hypothetical protein
MAARGLVNGANGTVIGFKANNKTIDTQGEQNPDEILVLFDDKNNHHTLVLNTEIFQCILGYKSKLLYLERLMIFFTA